MESKGRLVDAGRNIFTNKWRLTFEVEVLPDMDTLSNKDLRIKAVQWREKRSLNANAYFHVLVGKIAEALGVSQAECKNQLLSDFGQPALNHEGSPQYIIMREDIEWQNLEYIHLRPTTATKQLDDGRLYRVYMVIRGSHEYDTKEVSYLIDGTVEQAKQLGIETLTPAELSSMISRWERNVG